MFLIAKSSIYVYFKEKIIRFIDKIQKYNKKKECPPREGQTFWEDRDIGTFLYQIWKT